MGPVSSKTSIFFVTETSNIICHKHILLHSFIFYGIVSNILKSFSFWNSSRTNGKCNKCMKIARSKPKHGPQQKWIACDSCNKWYHMPFFQSFISHSAMGLSMAQQEGIVTLHSGLSSSFSTASLLTMG